ncbi:hypothetical protein EIP86_010309 [Pleurotus ostreatoroseus]|nr:hypothetical protein EIP86_010309 [Pleurotus ostreatoroseus]
MAHKSRGRGHKAQTQAPPPQDRRRPSSLSDEDDDGSESQDESARIIKQDLYAQLKEARRNKRKAPATTDFSDEERREMEEDPDADEDEDEERPRTRKRSRNDEDLTGGEDLEDNGPAQRRGHDTNSGDDDERREPERPNKRVRSNPTFTSTPATSVPSTIPKLKRKKPSASNHSQPSEHGSQLANGKDGSQDGPTPSNVNDTAAAEPDSPFKIVHGGRKAREGDASPLTRSLLKTMNLIFRVYLSTTNAWPNENDAANELKSAFKTACRQIHADRRLTRYEKDHLYAEYIGSVGAQRRSQLRGEVKSKAQALVAKFYQLEGTRPEIAARVKDLLSKKSFTFRDPSERRSMYGHDIFAHIIVQQWFSHTDSEGCGPYGIQFNPIPLPLIALVATAIHCALVDWQSGACSPKTNKFEYDVYQPIYSAHLTALETWQQMDGGRCATRQQRLWSRVWELSGREPLPVEGADDFDEEDYTRASDAE